MNLVDLIAEATEQLQEAQRKLTLASQVAAQEVVVVHVPGQGFWTQKMFNELAEQIDHLPCAVALFDLAAQRAGEEFTYHEVVALTGGDEIQQRNEHARLSRISRSLFGHKTWPLEARQGAIGKTGVAEMRYRMDPIVAEWWRLQSWRQS